MVSDSFAVMTLRPWFAWRPVKLGLIGTKWAWWRWIERTDIHGFPLYCEHGTQQRIIDTETEMRERYRKIDERLAELKQRQADL